MERAKRESEHAPQPYTALLPLETVVEGWRVVAWRGGGVHGAVYQAVRVGQEDAGPVALKLALLPRDPRFVREAALLSRIHHPSVPGLLEEGQWQHPGGTVHPYVIMEWVEGTPLYDWARRHNPTCRQVLRLLAQLARALQAIHAEEGLHRDVKGDNVLVRHTDSRAVLIDFGSGNHAGAATLTPPTLFPGTPAYRSPESWMFELRHWRDREARYHAGPADDLYALGVTAYRLVTGTYPELAEPRQDEDGTWQLEGMAAPLPLALNPRVESRLSALIFRMISVDPGARGSVEETAEALERAEESGALELDEPIFAEGTQPLEAGPRE
ncbi:serine/threonine-protein kinase, partial [Hyalangium sp.]|uniref:serine/threonine-protein kinase n=1 Tax=Hyalangium sp. TaxID=2028555 RepID=UPI002D5ED3A1